MEFNYIFWVKLFCSILAFLIAIIGHEIMHGYIAKYYGDHTASLEGRLSINPLKHIDAMGSFIVPMMLFFAQAPFMFGWAKPVPVNLRYITSKHGFIPAVYVSLAGIFYNLSLAIIISLILNYTFQTQSQESLWIVKFFCIQLVVYNVVLGIFNLFPIPPLDGSQALSFLCLHFGYTKLPQWLIQMQKYGFIIILIILSTPLSKIIFEPIKFLIQFLLF